MAFYVSFLHVTEWQPDDDPSVSKLVATINVPELLLATVFRCIRNIAKLDY
jgi:hypothetical protein